jgi:phosphoribosylformimino-5-aminoimidazole carboxamide ribotide isomerase
MDLLPALDLLAGRAVRLMQGDRARATDYGDPAAVLARYRQAGAARVHVVDLDAAFGDPPQVRLIAELSAMGLALQVGGGLRSREAVAAALAAGCERVVVGSMVARDPQGFAALARELPGRVVPALDALAGQVRIAGWQEGAGQSLADLCGALRGLPCPAVLVTDVARDGLMEGPNLELACRVAKLSGLPALVSGGVRELADLRAAAARPEVAGAIVGRALFEGAFSVEEALAAARGDRP